MMLFMSKRTLFTSVIYAVVGALFLFLFYVAVRNTVSVALMFSNVIIFYPDKFTTTWMVWISLRTTECGQERMVILYRWISVLVWYSLGSPVPIYSILIGYIFLFLHACWLEEIDLEISWHHGSLGNHVRLILRGNNLLVMFWKM